MRTWIVFGILSLVLLAGVGCRSEECARMEACCEEIKEMPGVGSSCAEKGAAMGDPKTCRTILETTRLMFRDREASPPEVCTGLPDEG